MKGIARCGEKQPSVPKRFLSLLLKLLIHIWQIVFSGGCGLREMESFLSAADSLKFAELFQEIKNELEAQVAEESRFSSPPPEPSPTGSPQEQWQGDIRDSTSGLGSGDLIRSILCSDNEGQEDTVDTTRQRLPPRDFVNTRGSNWGNLDVLQGFRRGRTGTQMLHYLQSGSWAFGN